LSRCNLSNYYKNYIGEVVAPRLTVVAAYTKQHMVVRREDDQKEEEEAPHYIVETPPITSELNYFCHPTTGSNIMCSSSSNYH
jgi:hypothetical protein